MSDTLDQDLAATAGEMADTPATEDAALDAVFNAPSDSPAGSDTSEQATTAPEPAAATVQPQVSTPDPAGAKGEPARWRWETILANARTKEREAFLKEWGGGLEVLQAMQRDLPGTLAQLLDEASADPRYAEQVVSRAAQILSQRQKAAKADVEPQPDLQTGDGELVYSAKQLNKWQEWRDRQTQARITEQFKPLQDLQAEIATHREFQQRSQEAASIAAQRGGVWKDMPFFADHKDAILARQQELYTDLQQQAQLGQRRSDAVNDPWDALAMAYREVVGGQAIPKLQTQQTQTLMAEAARKARGSMSDPAASAPAQPRKPRTEDEALDQVFNAFV